MVGWLSMWVNEILNFTAQLINTSPLKMEQINRLSSDIRFKAKKCYNKEIIH